MPLARDVAVGETVVERSSVCMALAKTTRPTLAATVARSAPPPAASTVVALDRSRGCGGHPVRGRRRSSRATSKRASSASFGIRSTRVTPTSQRSSTISARQRRAAVDRRRSSRPSIGSSSARSARSYFRELYDRLKPPFVLVFDNYQDVPAESVLHEVMREAVAELPSKGRTIFVSRSPAATRVRAPPCTAGAGPDRRGTAPFHAPRGAGPRAAARTRAVVAKDDRCAARVGGRVGCWARPSAEQLRNDGRTAQAPGERSSELLFDYFAGEIFKKTDPETQEILLQTAFLPRITAAMAESLTGQANAGRDLREAPQAGLLHESRVTRWQGDLRIPSALPRIPPLEGVQAYPPARGLDEDPPRAAELLESAGGDRGAAGPAARCRGLGRALPADLRHVQTLLAQGRASTVEDWLRSMPGRGSRRCRGYSSGAGMARWRGATRSASATSRARSPTFRRQGDAIGMFLAWSR